MTKLSSKEIGAFGLTLALAIVVFASTRSPLTLGLLPMFYSLAMCMIEVMRKKLTQPTDSYFIPAPLQVVLWLLIVVGIVGTLWSGWPL